MPTPTTPTEVVTVMIEQLQDLASDLEYLSSDEFNQFSPERQAEAWFDTRKQVKQLQLDHKELLSLMVKKKRQSDLGGVTPMM